MSDSEQLRQSQTGRAVCKLEIRKGVTRRGLGDEGQGSSNGVAMWEEEKQWEGAVWQEQSWEGAVWQEQSCSWSRPGGATQASNKLVHVTLQLESEMRPDLFLFVKAFSRRGRLGRV
eukprot:TRINITY_DN156_c0_g1_i1.p4 TRINITY_DN156_c0_g1~~TRINITY_DN156_c0_g1_i1.p4  ORF type:complete len:117 (+),score=26.46 TRINITY_DN156_c0_g1_i1:1415-1765(+)